MSEDQKKHYEEAAKEYATNKDNLKVVMTHNAYTAFLAGTEHAHPIGFNLGKEEGKKEGWNEAIQKAIDYFKDDFEDILKCGVKPENVSFSHAGVIHKLKKLKR